MAPNPNTSPNLQDNSIFIGYYDPFDSFTNVEKDLLKRFPIKKLAWKYSSDKPIKVIQNLPVQFKDEIPKLRNNENQLSVYRPNRTYLRLMFVTADTVDLYRSQTRPLILEWLKAFVVGQNVAWGIVYVTEKTISEKRSNLVKLSPFDKLRLDFGKGKQLKDLESSSGSVRPASENILGIQLKYEEEELKEEAYKELYSRIKELILITFSARYSENMKIINLASISTKGLEIGNSLKLADSFADLGFLDEANKYYKDISEQLSSWSSSQSINPPTAGGFSLSRNFLEVSPEQSYNCDELLQALLVREQKQIYTLPILFALFIKQCHVCYSMSSQGESTNHKLKCLKDLIETLMHFVNTSIREYGDSLKVKEWLFALVEYYLHSDPRLVLPSLSDPIDLQNKTPSLVYEISNVLGELALSQRRILNDFAINTGYELLDMHCLFQVVSLELKPEKYAPTYPKLVSALKNEDSFFDAFDDLTTVAIKRFLTTKRDETADLLSTDSALLNFKRGNYEYTYKILSTAYERLLLTGWSMQGGIILETYLKCAKILDLYDPQEVLPLYFQLFSLLKKNQKEESLHTYRSIKSAKECLQFMEELKDLSSFLHRTVEFPLLEMFTVTVLPGIEFSKGGECFIVLKIHNAFPIPISVNKISLTLANIENDSNLVTFSSGKFIVTPNNLNAVELFSNVMRNGEYSIRYIVVELTEKLHLVYKEDLQTIKYINDTVVQNRAPLEKNISRDDSGISEVSFLMVPHPEHFHIEMKKPIKLDICTPSLDCVVYSGTNAIKNVKVKVFKSFKMTDMSEPKIIEKMEAHTEQILSFEFPGDRGVIELQIICTYEIEDREFEFSISGAYDLNLDVSIVVTDIFQINSIFSKFKISAIDADLPFKVTNCTFSCPNGAFNVKGLLDIFANGNTLVVSGDQPATTFYQLTRSEDFETDSEMSDSFDFRLSYVTTKTECEEKVLYALKLHLTRTGHLKYLYVFEPVVSTMKFCWNSYLTSDKVVAKNLIEVNALMNDRIKQYFAPAEHEILENTLYKVLESDISLVGSGNVPHELYIPVGAPSIDVLHQVRFEYIKKQQCKVGDPIETHLIIKSSSKWANENISLILASSSPGQQSEGKAFLVRVHDDENWLYTGNQTHRFVVADMSAVTHISFSLLPVNAGEIVLPKVSIELVDQSITSDVVYENSLDTVLVVPELETVTFTL